MKLHLNLSFFFIDYSQLGAQDEGTGEKPFIFVELGDSFLWWLGSPLAFGAKGDRDVDFAVSLDVFEFKIMVLTVRGALMFISDGMHV